MTAKQRRFMVIMYWVGAPTRGALVGPVLVSTDDDRHFHFWDELEAATLRPGEYQVVTVYPLGMPLHEVERRFAHEFASEPGAAWLVHDQPVPAWQWAGFSQHFEQLCLSA